jgi:predicted RNase H-like nuclease (RuvC/YqgF family)
MSKKYNEWKEYLLAMNSECFHLDNRIIHGQVKPLTEKDLTKKHYMEYLEDEIYDLKKENEKLKIRYIDFKNIEKENEIYKIEILKLNQELIKIKSLHKNLEGYVKAEMDLIDLKSQLKKLQDS